MVISGLIIQTVDFSTFLSRKIQPQTLNQIKDQARYNSVSL